MLRATDTDLLEKSAAGSLDAPELQITGDSLASIALTRTAKVLSIADLNTIGVALLREAGKTGDLKTAASIYGTLAASNQKSGSQGKGKQGPGSDKLARALNKTAQALANRPAAKQVYDVVPEMPAGLEDDGEG